MSENQEIHLEEAKQEAKLQEKETSSSSSSSKSKKESNEKKDDIKEETKEEVKPERKVPKLNVENVINFDGQHAGHEGIVSDKVGVSPRGSSHVPVVWYKEKQEGDEPHEASSEEEGKKKEKKKKDGIHLPFQVDFTPVMHPVQSVKTLLSPRSQKKPVEDEVVVSFPVGRPEVATVIEGTEATYSTTTLPTTAFATATTTTTSSTTISNPVIPLKEKVEPAQPQVWYQEKPSEHNDIPKWRSEIQIHVSSSSEEEEVVKKKGKKEPVLEKIARSVSRTENKEKSEKSVKPKKEHEKKETDEKDTEGKDKEANPLKTLLSPRHKRSDAKDHHHVHKTAEPKTIKIYHIPKWRSTRPVWLYHELAAAYPDAMPQLIIHEFDPLAFRKEKPDWFLKINPNGKVPVMTYGDITMFDGVAICNFLLSQFDKDRKFFLSKNPEFLALFYQISYYCSGTVDTLSASSSPIQRTFEAEKTFVPDDENNHKAWTELVGPYMSQLLGQKKYFFGDEFTAIDLIVGYNCISLNDKKDWLKEFPNLLVYYNERILTRPSLNTAITFDHMSFKHDM